MGTEGQVRGIMPVQARTAQPQRCNPTGSASTERLTNVRLPERWRGFVMTGLGAMRMPLPYVRSWPKADRPVTGKFEESRPLAVHQSIAHSAETLFDKGHFGRKVIGISWLTLDHPCLMLNYLGQGALLLSVSPGKYTFRSSTGHWWCWSCSTGSCCVTALWMRATFPATWQR